MLELPDKKIVADVAVSVMVHGKNVAIVQE